MDSFSRSFTVNWVMTHRITEITSSAYSGESSSFETACRDIWESPVGEEASLECLLLKTQTKIMTVSVLKWQQ